MPNLEPTVSNSEDQMLLPCLSNTHLSFEEKFKEYYPGAYIWDRSQGKKSIRAKFIVQTQDLSIADTDPWRGKLNWGYGTTPEEAWSDAWNTHSYPSSSYTQWGDH
jgi:hypothetical protein